MPMFRADHRACGGKDMRIHHDGHDGDRSIIAVFIRPDQEGRRGYWGSQFRCPRCHRLVRRVFVPGQDDDLIGQFSEMAKNNELHLVYLSRRPGGGVIPPASVGRPPFTELQFVEWVSEFRELCDLGDRVDFVDAIAGPPTVAHPEERCPQDGNE